MSVFGILVVGGVRTDPLRALVALGSLTFAVALAVATNVTGIAASSGLRAGGEALDRHVDLVISGAGRGIDERIFPAVRDIDGVADARPVVEGDIVIGTRAGDATAGQTVHVIGVDLLSPIPGASGTGIVSPGPYAPHPPGLDPADALVRSGIVLSDRIARAYGVHAGSAMRVLANGHERTVRVAHVFPRDVAGIDSDSAYVDISTAQSLFERYGYLDRIELRVPENLAAVRARVAAELPGGTFVERPRATRNGLARLLDGLHRNLGWLAWFSLALGALFTYNAVGASVAQRRADIATLRGLGTRRWSIFCAFLGEGAAYGAIGAFAGAFFGIAAAQYAIARLVPDATRDATHALVAALPITVLLAIGIGIVAGTISAAMPALAAMRVPPASALGPASASRPATSAAYRAAFARLRSAGALRSAATYLGAHELVTAPQRTALVTIALTFAIANAIGYTIAGTSYARATDAWAQATFRGDVVVAARNLAVAIPAAMPSPTLARVRAVRGVATATPERSFEVAATDGNTFELRGDDSAAPRAAPSAAPNARETPAFVTAPLARRLHVGIGDRVVVSTPAGPRALRIAGLPADFTHPDGVAIVRFAQSAGWFGDDRADTIVVRTGGGIPAANVREALARTLATFRLDIETTSEVRSNTLALLGRSFAIARMLGAIALGIAVVGVGALLATRVLERRTTIGLLRYVGASRTLVARMVLYEATVITALACAIGTVAGLAGAFTALDVAGNDAFGGAIPVDVPIGTLAMTLAAVFAASIVAALPAARSAGRIGADTRPA